MAARVHKLKLPENPYDSQDFSVLDMRWLLVQDDQTCSSSTASPQAPNAPAVVQLGDIIFFPEILSGGGEFEGLFFALPWKGPEDGCAEPAGRGTTTASYTTNTWKLVAGGDVEMLVFPQEIADLAASQCFSLRERYEEPLNAMLKMQGGGLSLEDVFCGYDGGADAFWENPEVGNRRRNREREQEEWVIPYVVSTD